MARLSHNLPEGERGQILLAGAFTLALLLVVLAVVLNGVIYTGTASSQAGNTESRNALQYQSSSHETLVSLIDSINNDTDGGSDPENELREAVENWSTLRTRLSGSATIGTNASVTDSSKGYHIEQNTTRNFTDANLTEDWEVATDIDEVHRFRMNVSRDSLNSTCPNCFNTIFSDGAHSVAFHRDGSNISVSVSDGGGVPVECPANSSASAIIDFVNNSVAGTECTALEDIDAPDKIEFENTTDVKGTYDLIIKKDSDINLDNFVSAGETGPVATAIVYSAEISITYSTPRLTYTNTSIRVGPSEHLD